MKKTLLILLTTIYNVQFANQLCEIRFLLDVVTDFAEGAYSGTCQIGKHIFDELNVKKLLPPQGFRPL